ncbi:cytohesin-3 [Triplophysa dalaica]|uniref:cytohesin-3 n=1 Tax=Triplophysa dalaica TaxID=1582913 RepID=UPI0024DFA5B4|nr:cytohesin-3 [Triplophysa dalaica]
MTVTSVRSATRCASLSVSLRFLLHSCDCLLTVTHMKHPSNTVNMGSQRKDSFLWGKAPSTFTPMEKKQIEVNDHKHVILDDIQKLRLEIENMVTEIQTMEADEENKNVMKNKRTQCGKKKFNMDPKKGIQYLVDNGLLEWKPDSVSEFLYKEEGLNKTAIGNLLGEREEIHLQILKAFVDLHEFSNLNLVQALRQFLWSFRLPGEAQKIDRMMEAFALRYCTCNPGVFQSTDTCYILSFAIIMLNTSLHNPNVKDKTTIQRFISMNRGINNGEDLPDDLLQKLYESIKNEPFKIPEDDGNDLTHTFFNPDREGWLLKEGGRIKTWKRRWFILTDGCLYYFQYTTDKEPKGIIPLENLSVREMEDTHKQHCLELLSPQHKGETIKACKTETDGRVVMGKHQSYKLSAASAEECAEWIQAIRACITKDPFYDLVSVRKKKIINHIEQHD